MERLNAFIEKVGKAREFLERNSHRFSLVVTVGICCFMVLSAYDGMVQAQESPYVDVPGSYNSASTTVYSVTNDPNNNLQQLDANSKVSGAVNAAVALYGIEEGAFGEAARERALAKGLDGMQMKGLLGTVDENVIAMVTNPPQVNIPAHLANQWVPGYGSGSASTVYAQEDGYDFLVSTVGLDHLWSMFRNMAYAGFVIVIMVAGFMIMFRSKIDGQVTVNIVNALPGVIVGLILVTFSLAIVGFIIDIARLFTAIISNFMSGLPGTFEPNGISGPVEMAADAFGSAMHGHGVPVALGGGLLSLAMFITPATAIIGILGLLLIIIIGALALYAVVRVYITLVMSYVKIFIEVLLGPIYILLGSLPGKSSMIVNWLKRVLSAALVFPIVFFIINLGSYIGESDINTGLGSSMQFLGGAEEVGTPIFTFRGVFVIGLYFFAAGAPAIVDEMLAVVPSKGTQSAMEGTKKAIGKVPIIGGFFG
jgi:hypothetical protein